MRVASAPDDGISRELSRRDVLRTSGISLGAIALSGLLNRSSSAARQPLVPATARSIIYLHMIGAPSQLDLFDDKPELRSRNGEPCPESLLAGKRFAFIGNEHVLAGSPFQFRQCGESGHSLSELWPHLQQVADRLCVIHSLHTEEINHAPAQMFLHTGFGRGGRPSFGAWVDYGLGAETEDLPAYVVLQSGPLGGAGTTLWSSGFLPTVHQGVALRSAGDPVLFLSNPPEQSDSDRRRLLDATAALNRLRLAATGDDEIATRIEQYELAYRMQRAVPELADLGDETRETLDLYGVESEKPSFARNCLLARRLVERGVRLVELYDADWDHHSNLQNGLKRKCGETDRPIAALLTDLDRRGLLDETLVVWGSEFGRTPLRQGINGDGAETVPGRDHHKDAFTVWLAGGGVRGGMSYGKTDEFGMNVAADPVHVHDLNATILAALGLNHEQLTYRHQGREYRLTDVHGRVVRDILQYPPAL